MTITKISLHCMLKGCNMSLIKRNDLGFVSIRRFSAVSRFKNQYGIFFLMETVSY